jgi:hypothetical protein
MITACTTTQAEVSQDSVVVTRGDGGSVYETLRKYDAWNAQGKKIVIDGNMISSDAFAAFSAPNVCYTRNAVFSPHAASYVGLIPSYTATEQLTRMLPHQLANEFRSSVHFYNWITTAHYDFDDLIEIWPQGACENQTS